MSESHNGNNTRRSRLLAILLRVSAMLIALSAALGAFVVFEAASKTGLANVSANVAARAADPAQRRALLAHARRSLDESWAQPTRWHAGAVESRSWILALGAGGAGHDATLMELSREAAAHGVSIAPIQPTAWARLAVFGAAGRPSSICDVPTCLERSWRAAPMAELDTACARIRLANRLTPIRADDPRIAWFVGNLFDPPTTANCLDFLPAPDLMRLLLERARNERRARLHIMRE